MSNITMSNITADAGYALGMFDEFNSFSITVFALIGGVLSAIVGLVYANQVTSVKIPAEMVETKFLADQIANGAAAFLKQEYTGLAFFVSVIFVLLMVFLDFIDGPQFPVTAFCFLVGAVLSAGCGWMGMTIATRANVRTAVECNSDPSESLNRGLKVAFKSGAVMALSVVASGLLGLSVLFIIFEQDDRQKTWSQLTGFAFGASSIALFARVGGGIYTKAADVGADLVGKVEEDMAEDDPRNPATIADNVGDNVGDVAGMGADLFESFVGSLLAAATLGDAQYGGPGAALPFWVAGIGAICSIIGTFMVRAKDKEAMLAITNKITDPDPILQAAKRREAKLIELLHAIRFAIYGSSVLVIGGCFFACAATFGVNATGFKLFIVIVIGLVAGNAIGYFTEYATSYTEYPTKSIAEKATTGPATVIIQGLGVGMLSNVAPALILVVAILASYYLSGVYGIAVSGVGMLSTLGVTLATDAYGPVADNAGGIAEMAPETEIPGWVRDETDSLDALGNTTAATGKGFAVGSAVLTSLALMTAFATASNIEVVNLLDPEVLAGILVGALCPFVFAALTMLSVGKAAESIMYECRRQLNCQWEDASFQLDSQECVRISTESSLQEMVAPGTIAVFTPVVFGLMLGTSGLMGLLAGAISSGFLLAVTMANAGGAWDNAKKYIESIGKKKTDEHVAVVVGDTVGDPFKDTSGPALNILIKLMSVVSLLLAPLFSPTPWEPMRKTIVALIIAAAVFIFLYAFTKYYASGEISGRAVIDEKAALRKASPKTEDGKDEKLSKEDVASLLDSADQLYAIN